MRCFLSLCAVLLMLQAAPVAAKAYHGTNEVPDATNPNTLDPEKAEDEEAYRQEKVEKNSDGTERNDVEKENAERRRINGEGSTGPAGQENMFPNIGRKH